MTAGLSITPSAAIKQWVSAHEQKEQDYSNLMQSLQALEKLPTDEAFLLMMMIVMPEAMNVKGDSLSVSTSQLNISTSLSQIITNITNDVNGISPTNSQQKNTAYANDLIKQCNELSNLLGTQSPPTQQWTNRYTGKTEQKSWIGQDTWNQAVTSLQSLTSLVGTAQGAAQVVSNITNWINNPSKDFGQSTGEQLISQMNNSVTQEDNTFGGLSQMAQNAVSFLSSLYQQLQTCAKTLMQDEANMVGIFVQNNTAAAG